MADVDVLLPFHRIDNYLTQALTSMRRQVGIAVRLILIDDRSDETSTLPVNLIRPDDVYLRTPGAVGYGRSLEIGTAEIASDAVCLMNSDDISLPERLSRQLRMLEANQLCIARLQAIGSGGLGRASLAGSPSYSPYSPLLLTLGAYGADATWCSRSDWWRANAFFDSEPALDWRIALTSFASTSIAALDSVEYLYRKHALQVTRTTSESSPFEAVYESWRQFGTAWGLPYASVASARTIAAPWERGHDAADDGELCALALRILDAAREEGVEENVDRLIQRRLSIAAIRGPGSLSHRLHWGRLAGSDLPAFIALALDRMVRSRLDAIRVGQP